MIPCTWKLGPAWLLHNFVIKYNKVIKNVVNIKMI